MGGSICAVVVTYGDRQALVRPVLLALLKQDMIERIVLVGNNVLWDVQSLANDLAPNRIDLIENKVNDGSAAGFTAGIERAYESGAGLIWLLDDDNLPNQDTLPELLRAYRQLSVNVRYDRLAVLAFRPDHQRDIAAGVPLRHLRRRPSSFWGFHILDVPYKIWRRTKIGRPRSSRVLPPFIEMSVAPYGGLLIHRAVVEEHGLPRADFVLYGDDNEFTYRITSKGGIIRLVSSATMVDLESSWECTEAGTSFETWLKHGSDDRVFYGARNQTFLDSHCFPHRRLMSWTNRQVYCLVLWVSALVLRRTSRWRLLRRAIKDGLAGELGVVPLLL